MKKLIASLLLVAILPITASANFLQEINNLDQSMTELREAVEDKGGRAALIAQIEILREVIAMLRLQIAGTNDSRLQNPVAIEGSVPSLTAPPSGTGVIPGVGSIPGVSGIDLFGPYPDFGRKTTITSVDIYADSLSYTYGDDGDRESRGRTEIVAKDDEGNVVTLFAHRTDSDLYRVGHGVGLITLGQSIDVSRAAIDEFFIEWMGGERDPKSEQKGMLLSSFLLNNSTREVNYYVGSASEAPDEWDTGCYNATRTNAFLPLIAEVMEEDNRKYQKPIEDIVEFHHRVENIAVPTWQDLQPGGCAGRWTTEPTPEELELLNDIL